MSELEDAINKILLKDQPSIEDFEDFSGLLFDESGGVKNDSLVLVSEYFEKLQEKFNFIHNIIKDLSSFDPNPIDGELDEISESETSDNKDIKIYKQKRIGIPIEKLYEVLFAKKTIED